MCPQIRKCAGKCHLSGIQFFKASALWADAFYKSKCPSVCLSVCLSVRPSVRPSVCSLLRYHLNVFLPPLPHVGCPIFLEIRNNWGKIMERRVSDLNILVWKWSKIAKPKKKFFWADFALQNKVETTLTDGLETSGRRLYRKFWHISRHF